MFIKITSKSDEQSLKFQAGKLEPEQVQMGKDLCRKMCGDNERDYVQGKPNAD